MTVRATNNGFKALARKGTAGQEVFISTTKMELEDIKASELSRGAMGIRNSRRAQVPCIPRLLRGTIVNRTYGIPKNLYISLFSLTIFGPIYFGPP